MDEFVCILISERSQPEREHIQVCSLFLSHLIGQEIPRWNENCDKAI